MESMGEGDRVRHRRSGQLGTISAVRMNGYSIRMDDDERSGFYPDGDVEPYPREPKSCPLDGADSEILVTPSEYRYQCIKCGSRFNDQGEVQPTWDEESVEDHDVE